VPWGFSEKHLAPWEDDDKRQRGLASTPCTCLVIDVDDIEERRRIMSGPKYRNNIKIASISLIFVLMLFAEPVLGKKARSQSSRSGRSSQGTRSVSRSSAGSKVGRRSSVSTVRSRVSASSRSTTPRASRTLASTFKLSSGQSRRTGSSLRTIQRSSTMFRTSKPTLREGGFGLSGPSGGSSGSRELRERSSIRRTVEVARSDRRISSDKTSRIGKPIEQGEPLVSATREATRDGKFERLTTSTVESDSGGVVRRSESVVRKLGEPAETVEKSYEVGKDAGSRAGYSMSFRRRSIFTRPSVERSLDTEPAGERSHNFGIGSRRTFISSRPIVSRTRKVIAERSRHGFGQASSSNSIYRERSDVVGHVRSREHVYVDHHNTICHSIIRPRHRIIVHYNWGPYFAFRYFYPYYHRRYVFVSLGGYWPLNYGYMRYYWYGCHPYTWYGYYPIAREVEGDTYNYYTYNYYNDGGAAASESYQSTSGIQPVDHTTFADVRERLAQEATGEPDEVSLADRYFEDAVRAFEAGDYDLAAGTFSKAIEFAPDDMILPFAYCQALFADEKYTEAAEVLRTALANVTPEKKEVFYPRGLYAKEDVLLEQIDQLAEKAERYGFDGDLQLLLGYQLLGIGEIDEAVGPLQLAGQDLRNASSATVLLELLEKIKIEKADNTD